MISLANSKKTETSDGKSFPCMPCGRCCHLADPTAISSLWFLPLPASLGVTRGHVTQYWPMRSKQRDPKASGNTFLVRRPSVASSVPSPLLPPCSWPEREGWMQGGTPPQWTSARCTLSLSAEAMSAVASLRETLSLEKTTPLQEWGTLSWVFCYLQWKAFLADTEAVVSLSELRGPLIQHYGSHSHLLRGPSLDCTLSPSISSTFLYFTSSVFHILISLVLNKTFMYKTVPQSAIFLSCFCLLSIPPFTIIRKRAVYIHSLQFLISYSSTQCIWIVPWLLLKVLLPRLPATSYCKILWEFSYF